MFWKFPSHPLEPADLMVSPDHLSDFYNLIKSTEWNYETHVDNVQHLVDTENPLPYSGKFDWTRYHTLDEIYAWLDSLEKEHPRNVEIIKVGKSYEGRVIKGVKLSFGQDRPGVFIEGGIHAREWISPATVTFLINEFLTSNQTEVRKLAESYEWYIVPSLNPDGYVYTHTTVSFQQEFFTRF